MIKEFDKKLAENIRNTRIELGMSQTATARRMGSNPQTVWNVEHARNTPTVLTLVRLAKAMRVSPLKFLSGLEDLV